MPKSSSACEFEATAWLYNLLQDKVQHIGYLQNLGVTFCPKSNQEKILIACQVEPNAEQCLISWTQSGKTLEYVFPRQTVQNCNTVSELQNLSFFFRPTPLGFRQVVPVSFRTYQ